jgi:hypothetical protein
LVVGQVFRRTPAVIVEAVEAGPPWLDAGMVADEGLVENVGNIELEPACERVRLVGDDRTRLDSDRMSADSLFRRGRMADGDVDIGEPVRRRTAGKRQVME